jgi:hypothetical protein
MSSTPGVKGFPVVADVLAAEVELMAGEVVRVCMTVPADLQPTNRIAHTINTMNIRKNLIFIAVSSSFYTALYKYT